MVTNKSRNELPTSELAQRQYSRPHEVVGARQRSARVTASATAAAVAGLKNLDAAASSLRSSVADVNAVETA